MATSLLQELTASAAAGAVVHSNSWHATTVGGPRQPAVYDILARDVDEFTWTHESHLVLGASGNVDEEQGPPGTAKNAVCVSAAAFDGQVPRLGDGNAGPTADGRRKPDILAVGCGVQSAIIGTDCGVGEMQPCASSYATPLAAAAATLVRQYLREGRHGSGAPDAALGFEPSGALLKAILVDSALPGGVEADYPSDSTGWGLTLVDRQLPLSAARKRLLLHDVRRAQGLTTGTASEHPVQVTSSREPLSVTLTWTDPPGTLGAGNVAVNVLQLTVFAPDGRVFIGNVFGDGESSAGGFPDRLNNVQRVIITRPELGAWRVSVLATAINVGPRQGFALVITGDVRSPVG